MTLEDEELENETDGECEFVVEDILDNGWMYNGKKWIQHFLVKWSGFDESENTWEPKDNLCGTLNLDIRFWTPKPDLRPKWEYQRVVSLQRNMSDNKCLYTDDWTIVRGENQTSKYYLQLTTEQEQMLKLMVKTSDE